MHLIHTKRSLFVVICFLLWSCPVWAQEKTPSPENTQAPPSLSVVDQTQATWTVDKNNRIMRDGVNIGGGIGTVIYYLNNTIYVLGDDNAWWVWTGSTWKSYGLQKPLYTPPPAGLVVAPKRALFFHSDADLALTSFYTLNFYQCASLVKEVCVNPATKPFVSGAKVPKAEVTTLNPMEDGANRAINLKAGTAGTMLTSVPAGVSVVAKLTALSLDQKIEAQSTASNPFQSAAIPVMPTCALSASMNDWTKTAAPGGDLRVLVHLISPRPVASFSVLLNGVVADTQSGVNGSTAGMWIKAPTTRGTFKMGITFTDTAGCVFKSATLRDIVVK